VLAALGRPPPPPVPRRKKRTPARAPQAALPLPPAGEPLEPAEATVLAALGASSLHVDEVCERTGLPGSAAVGALLTLTLRAVVVEGPAGFFRRVTDLG
jgi:DNA processing protein